MSKTISLTILGVFALLMLAVAGGELATLTPQPAPIATSSPTSSPTLHLTAGVVRTYPCSWFRGAYHTWCIANIRAGYHWRPILGTWKRALHQDYPRRNFNICRMLLGDTTIIACPDHWVTSS